MRKLTECTEVLRNNRFVPKLTVVALLLSGCSGNDTSFLTDTSAVYCDEKPTKTNFGKDQKQADFTIRPPESAPLTVSVTSTANGEYSYGINSTSEGGMLDFKTLPVSEGDSFDYKFESGKAVWMVDVQADQSQVLISGQCL